MTMVRLTDILDKVTAYHPTADADLINKAYVYASRMHEGQRRKSGDPYFIHPVSVAHIIADMHLDGASVCAALLHDVVEDTVATEGDISALFGQEIAFLVDGVTKLGKINFISKEDQQAESFRKMLIAMARDIRVLLVKLADRLDNMRTLDHMSVDSQERIARETLEIYAPLAGRLGIQWIKNELQDLAFKYISPEQFADLSRQTKKLSRDREKYVNDVCKRIERMLVERNFAVEVSGRIKGLYSLWEKMRKHQCEFDQVYDYVAFRVVVENVADCYASLGVIHSQWTPIPGRFKDYIALPKPNMYQSLHTTVIGPGHRRIEVQIRTREMHKVADFGIAAHWKYKQNTGGLDAKDAAKFAWLRQLMEFQKEVKDPQEFLESVKVDLFNDEVYVFTPKGDVRVFPRGATPIDFAYSIHSQVGEHCSGARVNGVLVSLRHEMHNGDTIEIVTSPNQKPSKDWLDFVASGRARSRIRVYLRAEERKQSIELGKELLEREMHKRDLSLNRALKSGVLEKELNRFPVGSIDELYAALGYGKLEPGQVVEALEAQNDSTAKKSLKPTFFERTVRKVTRKEGTTGIRIAGIDDVLVRFAKCCNPLPGDPITGFITRGRGVTVHRRACRESMELDPDRRIDVSWADDAKVQRPVQVRVVTADRPGILSTVTGAFTDTGLNITEATCRSLMDGRSVNTFQFTVADAGQLKVLMRNIAKIQGVYDVERV
ncbi:MAG TPA: bifunctional (p)ppGpp synthetase/guanosine-3',5'-bis(diphosphate) 3'-pyrophosphohydrolase [Polyangiales bacterium]|nr:bifunctional (p)ppGpp synthetase/guanosine-3',5'-bis(diphosphate) 3'-pyrophosphohydrolase [Polyangiales bacterium]